MAQYKSDEEDLEYDEDCRFMSRREAEELEQTREDACPECHTIHAGECF